jgi:hypothetical protein
MLAVSPLPVGTPAAKVSPPLTACSLFHAVHNQPHVELDWEHFYKSPAGEEEEMYLLLEELGREIVNGGSSNNEHPKWNVESSGENVVISFNELQDEVWKVGKAKIEAYRDQICKLTK